MTLHLADHQAFACNACGLCCTRPWGVPVEPEVESGIRASAAVAERERQGYQPLLVVEGKMRACRQKNGHCVFLTDEVMCSLHAELGERGKPIGCQFYPYRATTTPGGTYVSMSFACPTVVAGTSRDLGASRRHLEEILERWPQAADVYEQVTLVTGKPAISWEEYAPVEDWLLGCFEGERPVDSLLSMAASLSALVWGRFQGPNQGSSGDPEGLRMLLASYAVALVSIAENEHAPAARGDYGQAMQDGHRTASSYFLGRLPVFELERGLPPWARQVYQRYVRDQILGKAILTPSVVARLLALALAYPLLSHYAEGLRLDAGEEELSLASLTRAFEIVEGDIISHSPPMQAFFLDFEATLPRIFEITEDYAD